MSENYYGEVQSYDICVKYIRFEQLHISLKFKEDEYKITWYEELNERVEQVPGVALGQVQRVDVQIQGLRIERRLRYRRGYFKKRFFRIRCAHAKGSG